MALRSAIAFAERAKTLLPDSKVYLFGSQVKGCATAQSDIDIAILCDNLGNLEFDEYRSIWKKLLLEADEVDPIIEPHLISCMHEHSGFLDTILETGIQITDSAD